MKKFSTSTREEARPTERCCPGSGESVPVPVGLFSVRGGVISRIGEGAEASPGRGKQGREERAGVEGGGGR